MEGEASEKARRTGATKVGVVVSHKAAKTAVIRVERTVSHPAYKRYRGRSAKFMAHDERGLCKAGDTVEIVESSSSAHKRWRVRRVVRAAVAGFHEEIPGVPRETGR
jgi:small subunit ribosomal protein S17